MERERRFIGVDPFAKKAES
ncbi:hypothetical protein KIPB_004690, partial [Kipferlia bialata]|eukprot:g4690.t1